MSGFVETGTYLDRILARTAADVEVRKATRSITSLEQTVAQRTEPWSLINALSKGHVAVISEFKRASPSKGRFPVEIQSDVVARDYVNGGASAISVLTDEPFFQGSLDDMDQVSQVARGADRPVPVLRKDFVIDAYQLYEARAFGADAALLIVAALQQEQLQSLMSEARSIGLSTLVEIHDERELERAVAAGAEVIGINNRDLRSFGVDLAVSERLAPMCPSSSVVVAESGIFTRRDVERLAAAGASAILVGEALILAENRQEALRALGSVPRRAAVS